MMVMAQYRWKSDEGQERRQRQRRAMAKESLAKVWESMTKTMNTEKFTIKEKKEEERQRKRTRKDEKPAPNSSFQGYCRSCGNW